MQIMELPQVAAAGNESSPRTNLTHPYFIGAQFHPELTSRPLRPQPMFMGLVAAAIVRKFGHDAAGDPAIGRWVRSKAPERQPVA